MIEINRNPAARDLRIFAVLQIVFFGLVAWSLSRHGFSAGLVSVIVGVSVLVGAIGVAQPSWVRPIFVGWLYAVFPIGWAVSHLLMAVTFYGLIAPLGWAARLAGHDPLRLRWDREASTYWEERPTTRPPEDYFKQY